MQGAGRFIYMLASVVLWVLVLIGFAFHFAFVPALSHGINQEFEEFANDRWLIQGLITAPVIFGQILLLIIIFLLRRIRAEQMFSTSVYKWVRLLAVDALALAASFVTIFVWLNIKNTLPPAIGIVLLVAILLSLAVSLVTASLLGLLKKATDVSQELEGVI